MTIKSCLRLRYRGLHRHLTLAVFRRYYEEFAASYRKSLRAAEAKGEIRRGVRAGCEGADGAEEVSIPQSVRRMLA